MWNQGRLSVRKQNRSNTKNVLNSLAAIIHKNERDAAGNNKNVLHPRV